MSRGHQQALSSIAENEVTLQLSRRVIIAILCSLLTSLILISSSVYGVPAQPVPRELRQADGTAFEAWQQGDEWLHWWETAEGYTILFDESSRNWVYAKKDWQGKLVKTKRIAARHAPPPGVRKHLKPPRRAPVARIQNPTEPQPGQVYAKVVPSSGTRRLCVLLVNFADRTLTYTAAQFTNLLFNTTSPNDSMTEYYREVSYYPAASSLNLVGTVYGPYTGSQGHDYYGQNDAQGYDMWPHILVREAVIAADSTVNFAQCDNDGNGYVDGVIVIHQGTDEAAWNGTATDIWSHMWSLNAAQYWMGCPDWMSPCGEYTTNDGVKVNAYSIQAEIASDDGMATIGVFAHEFGHLLGLPDLYDYDYDSDGVGQWSIMASGCWNGTRPGDTPTHFSAWEKSVLSWVTPTQITSPLDDASIPPVETYATVYQLLDNPGGTSDWFSNCTTSGGEYFLVENRRQVGFDSKLPGSGVLIWHVDESPVGGDCRSNDDQTHKLVDLEEADGLNNLDVIEYPFNDGDTGDPYPGSSNNKYFDNNSNPNSKLYGNNSSGVCVTNIYYQPYLTSAEADMGINECSPYAPSNLTATAISETSIRLDWQDNSTNEAGFSIYVFKICTPESPGCFDPIASVGPNITTYTDASLSPGQQRTYYVRAYNAAGDSLDSNYASATTPIYAMFRVTREGDVYADRAYFCGLSSGCFNAGSGADIAEYINTIEPVEVGDVVELDPEHPGYYRKSRRAYSTLVAGVISTAPGITMGQGPGGPAFPLSTEPSLGLSDLSPDFRPAAQHRFSITLGAFLNGRPSPSPMTVDITIAKLEEILNNKPLLALMGVVPVKATTENGPIRPGDLLVSSSLASHVMRCPDPHRCEGAIVGKALEPLEKGQGVIRTLLVR